MVDIRAALSLEHGGAKDFYICSLSSRYLFQFAFTVVLRKFYKTSVRPYAETVCANAAGLLFTKVS